MSNPNPDNQNQQQGGQQDQGGQQGGQNKPGQGGQQQGGQNKPGQGASSGGRTSPDSKVVSADLKPKARHIAGPLPYVGSLFELFTRLPPPD